MKTYNIVELNRDLKNVTGVAYRGSKNIIIVLIDSRIKNKKTKKDIRKQLIENLITSKNKELIVL